MHISSKDLGIQGQILRNNFSYRNSNSMFAWWGWGIKHLSSHESDEEDVAVVRASLGCFISYLWLLASPGFFLFFLFPVWVRCVPLDSGGWQRFSSSWFRGSKCSPAPLSHTDRLGAPGPDPSVWVRWRGWHPSASSELLGRWASTRGGPASSACLPRTSWSSCKSSCIFMLYPLGKFFRFQICT